MERRAFCRRFQYDGLTNIIYKLSKKSDEDDFPILFRIYGAGSSDFLNREKELKFLSVLSKNNFGIELLCSFPEGRMELWRVGFTSLNDLGCRDPKNRSETGRST
ncbi:hypothetical protein JH06_1369 [Blastocystis sp. subtype 4]|uniref:hypothetical protein n=1 Tax=Blastocystis sp. subtype 4 TaxID=944170 RepID=UPI0007121639|nr:hypothetical protein JH06_1369 [Blastocystis sp. subtype 4]KNB45765.1 hypothetical protein JH06_1369 [Blastocystis sp. subtype 4]|eukprot:XP_014529208.1 hypothetical protein JH06_1369 [Blastocystis sp. subtype 4]